MDDFWRCKRVFVTGATGLVGAWVTKALVEKDAYVVALIRDYDPQSELIRNGTFKKISVVNGSLEDGQTVQRAINEHEIDTVFHFGAQTIVGAALRNPLAAFESNIRGTYHLLEACRLQRNLVMRIVIASSDKAYGTSPVLPYTEEMPLIGQHPYDVSKSCADLISLSYYHTYGLPITIARCGNIFGGGDLNWSRIVPGTIRNLILGLSPEIRSDGSFTRDYLYIQDVVHAYLLLGACSHREDVQGQAFNFGPNRPYTVMEIVKAIQAIMNRTEIAPKIVNSARAEIRDQTLCSQKAKQRLGWSPKYALEEGLMETIDWYSAYFEGVTETTCIN